MPRGRRTPTWTRLLERRRRESEFSAPTAERGVGSLRRECLDRLLIVGRRHLETVVRIYAKHYNEHRPHRSLSQHPPLAKPPPIEAWPASGELLQLDRLRRRDRLGGLLHEYELAA